MSSSSRKYVGDELLEKLFTLLLSPGGHQPLLKLFPAILCLFVCLCNTYPLVGACGGYTASGSHPKLYLEVWLAYQITLTQSPSFNNNMILIDTLSLNDLISLTVCPDIMFVHYLWLSRPALPCPQWLVLPDAIFMGLL